MHNYLTKTFISLIAAAALACAAVSPQSTPPVGFGNSLWGDNPDQVKTDNKLTVWQQTATANLFPDSLKVSIFTSASTIAGYKAQVKYYFYKEKLFQATVTFPMKELVSFDFNYNVFRSVDAYYRAIHDKTLTFVADIYTLLSKKYGKKEPYFERLDPRRIFVDTDDYLRKEQWNLRYHPYEYYKRIVASAYARWDYPKTRILFSVNLSAADKRFDYTLSLTSLALEQEISKRMDELRAQGL